MKKKIILISSAVLLGAVLTTFVLNAPRSWILDSIPPSLMESSLW